MIVRQTRLLLLLLTMLNVVNASAAINGDKFTKDGMTYVITDVAHHKVAFAGSNNSGAISIPATVNDSVNIVWTVTRIQNNSNVPNATSVVIPNTVTAMEANSLAGNKMTTVSIPASVTSMDNGVFNACQALQAINVDAGNTKYYSDNGVLYERDGSKMWLLNYPIARPDVAYTVPEGTTGVRVNAFQSAKNIQTVTLPTTLVDLPYATPGYNGFTSAQKLTAINVATGNPNFKSDGGVVFTNDGKELVVYPCGKGSSTLGYDLYTYEVPATVEKIRPCAFAHVEGFTSVKMSSPLKEIGEDAFNACRYLQTVTIPSTVNKIADGAFSGSIKLTAINVESGNTTYSSADGVLYNAAQTELVSYPAGKQGPYTTLPTTKTIRTRAFYYAAGITKLTLTPGVEEIGNDAFQQTHNLKELVFQPTSTFKKMGTWAFVGSGLEKLELPASLETLGTAAFNGCTKLKTVTVADGSQLQMVGQSSFAGCTSLESFQFLGSSVAVTIGKNAFSGDTKLPTFTIPGTVTTIEEGAFNGCSAMTSVTFDTPARITTIGAGAFQNAGLLSIHLPESVTTIEQSAFNSCQKLTKIDIPAATTSIDPKAFQFCGSLTELNADPGNPKYSSVDGFLLSKDKKTLIAFPPGKASTYYTMLPPTIEEIGPYAFYYVQKLENVTIPELVNKIDAHAFDMCKQLNTIAFLSKTPIPADKVDNTAFYAPNVDKSKIDLSVRKGSESSYAANTVWNGFNKIGVSFFKDPNGYGNTEYFPLSKKAVMVVDVQSDVYTYVVPAKVTNTADSMEYEVRLWGDYAMKNSSTNIKEVVFRNTLDYVGIDAFKKADGSTTVESAFFTCATPAKDMSATKWELGSGYSEFATNLQHIFVKKSAVGAYKAAEGWTRYASNVDYKIPGVSIKHKYGTFAREFDANLGIYKEEKDSGDVAAFVAPISGVTAGSGDYGSSAYNIRMTSIDENGGVTGDYSYVPAETGVLLKAMETEALPVDFYYAIGEKDNVSYNISGNMMIGVTVKNKQITTGSDPLYVVSANEGIFKKAPATLNMPVHKAYAKIAGVPAGAKVMFAFDDDNTEITGIENINSSYATADDNGAYYNLNGQRVGKPQHGVYIHNGKKIIIK